MPRRQLLTVGIAIGMGLVGLGTSVGAQTVTPVTVVADTGLVTLGPNQVVRLSITWILPFLEQDNIYRQQVIHYAEGACQDDVCAHSVTSDVLSGPLTLRGGTSSSTDIAGGQASAVRAVVRSDSRRLKITATIIDTTTGQIIAILIG